MEDAFPLFGLAAVILALALLVRGSAIAWSVTRDHDRVRRVRDADMARLLSALQEQLARLENAIDAQSVEIERLAEGQRFNARLLAERQVKQDALPAASPEPPVITPH